MLIHMAQMCAILLIDSIILAHLPHTTLAICIMSILPVIHRSILLLLVRIVRRQIPYTLIRTLLNRLIVNWFHVHITSIMAIDWSMRPTHVMCVSVHIYVEMRTVVMGNVRSALRMMQRHWNIVSHVCAVSAFFRNQLLVSQRPVCCCISEGSSVLSELSKIIIVICWLLMVRRILAALSYHLSGRTESRHHQVRVVSVYLLRLALDLELW